MDPHFNEYLAAVAGLHDVYGEPACDGPSDFHEEPAAEPNPAPSQEAAAA